MNHGEDGGHPRPKRHPVISFLRDHPYFTLLMLAVIIPVMLLACAWTYLRVTTQGAVDAQLRARGLPLNGEELTTWNHPADDGKQEFTEALNMMEALQTRLGDEFNKITTEWKPEDFPAHKKELEDFFAALQPIQQKMAEANRHASLTYGLDYRNIISIESGIMMAHRIYALSIQQQAIYESLIHNNPDNALRLVLPCIQTSGKLCTYTLIEMLVQVATAKINCMSLSQILEHSPPNPQAIRQVSQLLQAKELQERFHTNLYYAYAGETVFISDACKEYRNDWSKHWREFVVIRIAGRELPFLTTLQFFLLYDLDYQTCIDDILSAYDISLLSYPEHKTVREEHTQRLHKRYADWGALRYLLMWRSLTGPVINAIYSHYKSYALMQETGIACELAADRLEGKPWPADLNDPKWPRDPFTDQPFRLMVNQESVLICSPGPDLKDSGKAELFNRTGDMNGSEKVPACAGEDDIIFRLPRALYDQAAQKQ